MDGRTDDWNVPVPTYVDTENDGNLYDFKYVSVTNDEQFLFIRIKITPFLKLIEENQFEVPPRLVQYEINEYLKQTEETLSRGGMNLESAGINRAEAEENYRDTAVKRVRGDFILKQIADAEERRRS